MAAVRLATALARRLGLRVPIIQAPMAGGPSTPALVAAASGAGALGSFGHAYATPETMARDAQAVRALTAAPFGINLFAAPPPGPIAPARLDAALAAVAPYFVEHGLAPPTALAPPFAPDLERQLEAVLAVRPAVCTIHLGELAVDRVRALQAAGIVVGASATCVAEARRAQAQCLDFVIAQGGEAGGHRGTWLRDPQDALTGTLALTRLVVQAVDLPVVAAGGIMDGAGIAAVLALGAQAAQLGTAFLACPESGAPAVHKRSLLEADEDSTAVTDKFSGKPARGLANRYLREMRERDGATLPFPAQSTLLAPLRARSAASGSPDFVSMWAGQAAPLARALPAAELITALEAETLAAIERLAALRL